MSQAREISIEQLFSREADDLAPPTVEPCPTVFERLIADADCGVVERRPVGRYRDVGMQRFIFSLGSAAFPAPYKEWIETGAWATRDSLEAFAAQAMWGMQSSG